MYAAADAFLAPALGGESFGQVLLEAMAAGVPVAGSDIPGYREVARAGREALLVPPGQPAALAEAALRLLEDRQLAAGLRQAGRERAREFAWEGLCPDVERAYLDATTGPHPLGAADVVAIGSAP